MDSIEIRLYKAVLNAQKALSVLQNLPSDTKIPALIVGAEVNLQKAEIELSRLVAKQLLGEQ